MKIGDMVQIVEKSFLEENIFGYVHGDIGIIRDIIYFEPGVSSYCIVMLIKNFKIYHIPEVYMKKMEKEC